MTQIRGPFPLPDTSPQICGIPSRVALGPGGIYLLPAGNYLVHTGPLTVLQWFDPMERHWTLHTPSQDYTDVDSDGANYRLVNMSGTVVSTTISAAGTGGVDGIGPIETQGTTIGFAAPPPGTAGAVLGVAVTNGGTGYTTATATINTGSGTGATLTPVITGGVITGITVTAPGSGYQPTDTVTIAGDGTGATATLSVALGASAGNAADGYVIIGGQVPVPTISQAGSRFEVAPVIACDPPPYGGLQATFVATIDVNGRLAEVTQVFPGAGYKSPPQFYVIPQPRHYQGAPRFPLIDNPNFMPLWPAPGLISPYNVWPGTLFQENIDKDGALLISNPLVGSGTLTGVVLTNYGSLYTAAPAVTLTAGSLTGATVTATLSTLTSGNDVSVLQAKVTS